MDLHYTGRPNHGAVLRAVCVADKDGATGFGDLAKAYDALDVDTQRAIASLEVAYRFGLDRRKMRFVDLAGHEPGPHSPSKPADLGFPDFDDAVYPAVVTHPVTGRDSGRRDAFAIACAHRHSDRVVVDVRELPRVGVLDAVAPSSSTRVGASSSAARARARAYRLAGEG